MRCLFLGYSEKETSLIRLLKRKGCRVTNLSKTIKIKDLERNDFYVSFGYKKIIPKNILKYAKRPIINLHMSFLPFNRGAHPNFWSFVNKTPSGVTIHEINNGVDTGPIIFQKKIKFNLKKNKNLTFQNTYNYLFKELEKLFKKNIKKIIFLKYKKKTQKKILKLNKKKDLPKNIQKWNVRITDYIKVKK